MVRLKYGATARGRRTQGSETVVFPPNPLQPTLGSPRYTCLELVSIALFPVGVNSSRLGGHLHLELDPSCSAFWAGYTVKRS